MSQRNHLYFPRKILILLGVSAALCPLWMACATLPPRTAASATPKKLPLTLATIYGPGPLNFSGSYAHGLQWSDDGAFLLERVRGEEQKVDPLTGGAEPAYDRQALTDALHDHEDFGSAAYRLADRPTALNVDRSLALFDHKDQLYLYRFESAELTRLTEAAEGRQLFTFSPDSAYLTFARENNLYAVSIPGGKVQPLTSDGSDTLLNGVFDWVYQEELYGRGQWQAYWWSPDSQHVAYLQLDEANVPLSTVVDYTSFHPELDATRYPRPGDTNPTVRLGVVSPTGGETVWVDLSKYGDTELLIVGVAWSPDNQLVYCVQDRESRWLELNEADPATGAAHTLLRESTPAWTELYEMPHWLKDESFLWRSARDGWQHLYHYTRSGELMGRITEGPWEVRDLHGVDEEHGWVYLSGTRDTPLESHAYRVPLAGGPVERLTTPGFSHRVSFDPQFRYFIDTFSSATTPPKVDLRGADGRLVRVISPNEVALLDRYELSPPEFVRVPTSHGHELNAMLIRPLHIEPGRKYPVMTFTYAGPHAPSVSNRWGGRDYLFMQLLAQKGYFVWECDPYSASGEGDCSAWYAYRRLGATELEDLEDSLRWLAAHEAADIERVGIYGSSYGGYMAAYAVTHGTLFHLAITESGLADWHNYDSVYTERYMQTPANNPEGYQLSSVSEAAQNLHGRLLIAHGGMDDNVHLQNALQLSDKLEQADKDFDLMIYPLDGHGLYHYPEHWHRLRLRFIEENL